ncbi:hypothetical protein WJX81_008089 [Elliptochloris bilobata]|uniref:Uncharacterized protein n=1 Tax=Elliptochloris bilobata TaxID=381761 RepID=A0AAW1QKX5_9CHLO
MSGVQKEMSKVAAQMPKLSKHAHHLTTEPYLTTAAREAQYMWPFLVGFAVTGAIFFNIALGLTDEDIRKSKFSNPNQKH